MPMPLSARRIRRRPPASTSRRNSVAPASSEFSSSSLTTEAGRSTTSPAAILLATLSERTRILPIEWPLAAHRAEEFTIAAGLAQLIQQQLHAFDWRQRVEHPAQHEHAVQLFTGNQQLFLARA